MEPDPDTLARQFDAQRAFFRSGATEPISFRRERLKALCREVERRSDDILTALGSDLNRPPVETWLSEVYFVLAEGRHIDRNLERWAKPVRAAQPFYFLPSRSEVRHEPQGCVLIAGTWNYPLQLSLSPLMAAVAAGNCVTLKPSEHSPATSKLIAELIESAFSREHVSVVEGGPEQGAALLDLPFDHFFCTGGENIGRLFAEAAAKHLAPSTLELGGKCPCLLDRNIALNRAVERITWGKFFNAGQTCVAPDFVLVPEDDREEFVSLTKDQLETCYGSSPGEDLAGIVNDQHYHRLLSLIPEDAIAIGEDDPGQRRIAPRLIPNADWDAPVMKNEIFGPILPIIGYESLDEALEKMRHLPDPLALYCFSESDATREKVAGSMRSGAVCFNDVGKPTLNFNLPFGGVGPSGHGRYHGQAGFLNFTYARSYVHRSFVRDPFLILPPYKGRLSFVKRFLK